MKQAKKLFPLCREGWALEELRILVAVAGLSGKDRLTIAESVVFNLVSPKDTGSLSFLGVELTG